MAKGKSTWKYNKLLTARRNYFVVGGDMNSINRGMAYNFPGVAPEVSGIGGTTGITQPDLGNTKTNQEQEGNSGGNSGGKGLLNSIGSVGIQAASDIAGMVNNITASDVKERSKSLAKGINAYQMGLQPANDSFDALIADYANTNPLEHVTADQLGAKGFGQGFGEALVAGGRGFAAGASLGPWGAAASAVGSTATSIIGNLFRNRKAEKEAQKLNELIDYTNMFNERSLANRATNIEKSQLSGLEANYAALGGPMDFGGGAINYDFMNQYLGIKELAALGKNTSLGSLPNSFAFGGDLLTHGANFDTGVTVVDNGGTHEENPYEGVPMGVDNEGIPNLVEEGEVIFNDYVFSNRLKVPKEIRKKYKLRGIKPLTFADAAKQMSKESEERPNDPISKAGLEDSMMKLMMAQEELREKTNKNRKYARGGKLGRLFVGLDTDPYPNRLRRGFAITPFEGPDPIYVTGPGYNSGYNPPIPEKEGNLVNPEKPYITIPAPISNNIGGSPAPSSALSPTWMRKIPAYASGFMALNDALGFTNKPDYSEADMVLDATGTAGSYSPVGFKSIGNYLEYDPFDRQFYINPMNAQSGATRRAIMNNAGLNRGTAMAGLLAADYNYGNQLGQLARQAEEYNLAQRQKVEEFNRATDMFNTEGALKADIANQESRLKARDTYLKGVLSAAEIRQKERQQSAAARSANLSNFIESLGDIGRENFSRNMIMSDPSKYYWIDDNGAVHYKGAYDALSSDDKKEVDKEIKSKTRSKANGGYLTRRKKRR